MADIVDTTDESECHVLEARVNAITAAAAAIPKGEPGECRHCGEESLRLVGKACAPCRDLRNLP